MSEFNDFAVNKIFATFPFPRFIQSQWPSRDEIRSLIYFTYSLHLILPSIGGHDKSLFISRMQETLMT